MARAWSGVLASFLALGVAAETAAEEAHERTVVVELFSSEGCSSCPPADKVLRKLESEGHIGGARVIALEFHVDYWNELGWPDPFSDGRWTARQRDYARVFSRDGVYTPQAIVDGREQFVGSDEARARHSIAAAANRSSRSSVDVQLARAGSFLDVHVRGPSANRGANLGVWLAVTESGLGTTIPRGENAGRTVEHGPIVRHLSRIGVHRDAAFDARVPLPRGHWRDDRAHYVVFVQDDSTRAIFGANIL